MTESTKADPKEMYKALFVNLVMMLASSAMQQLGKLVNPLTNKTEVSLEGAEMTIDMLEMIQAKTQGNLDKDEERIMKDSLSSLQLNFVETARSAPAAKPSETPAPETAGDNAGPGSEDKAPSAEPAPGGKEKPDPKYHKSYGE